MEFPKPNVIISRCIEHGSCRYNGEMINDRFISKLKDYVNFIPVCPEIEMGLGVPRKAVRIVHEKQKYKLVQSATNTDLTKKITDYTSNYIKEAKDIDGFLLKYKSPTCGKNNVKVYLGSNKSAASSRGEGLFAKELMKAFPSLPLEDEKRLDDPFIRELFLTQIFTFSRFRLVKEKNSITDLMDFQSQNKYVFMMHNPKYVKLLGQILAKFNKKNLKEITEEYEKELHVLFSKNPNIGSMINTFTHIFGGFSKDIADSEKEYFNEIIEEFRDERIAPSIVIDIIHSYVIKNEIKYLKNQTIFKLFPKELATFDPNKEEVVDSETFGEDLDSKKQ